jgi:hypothetical protein
MARAPHRGRYLGSLLADACQSLDMGPRKLQADHTSSRAGRFEDLKKQLSGNGTLAGAHSYNSTLFNQLSFGGVPSVAGNPSISPLH